MAIDEIAGILVPDENVRPETNIYGRKWLARGDMHGTFRGTWPTPDGLKPPGLVWVFDAMDAN